MGSSLINRPFLINEPHKKLLLLTVAIQSGDPLQGQIKGKGKNERQNIEHHWSHGIYLHHPVLHLLLPVGLSNMKTIIDNETGEVIEVEEQNEIATRLFTDLGVIDKETYEILDSYLYYKEQLETFRYKLEKAMKEHDIKKWDNDYFTAIDRADSVQKRVDVDKLKEDGIYEKYIKLVPIKGGLQIKFKKGV